MASEQKQGRSPELRKDWVTNRWVIFSPARAKRPSDFKYKSPATNTTADQIQDGCPFCLGHEHLCAPEIFRVPTSSDPDWKIRVIQNLYPALDRTLNDPIAVAPNPNLNGVEVLGGFGFHDVVIETPFHSLQLSDLSSQQISEVLLAYKNRILQLAAHSSIHYVQVLPLFSMFIFFNLGNCERWTLSVSVELYGSTIFSRPCEIKMAQKKKRKLDYN